MQWWRDRLETPGSELLPDVQIGTDGTKASIYARRRATLFTHLDLLDPAEDGYALRLTISSRLTQVGAADGEREALLGHEHEKIVNRHYTEHHLPRLKALLDEVDYGLEIVDDEGRGHPVIARCSLGDRPPLKVQETLDAKGRLTYLRVLDPVQGEQPFISVRIPVPGETVDEARRERVQRAARMIFRRAKTARVEVGNTKIRGVRDPDAERAVSSFIALGMIPSRPKQAPVAVTPSAAPRRNPAA